MEPQESTHQKADILVIGGGHFGQLAVERLGPRVVAVVEPEPTTELMALGAPLVRADGIAHAGRVLAAPQPPRFLAPMLPLHFLARWLELATGRAKPLALPAKALPQAALTIPAGDSSWHLSLADFRCPDDCPEPPEKCYISGKPRGAAMYERLASIHLPGHETATLRSYQLAPGVGGLLATEMLDLAQRVKARRGKWVLGSSCLCHGVVEALDFGEVQTNGDSHHEL